MRNVPSLTGRCGLVAVLDELNPGLGQHFYAGQLRCLEQSGVHYCIQLRKDKRHSSHFALAATNRSMKCVSRRPLAKSSSAQIFQWSGIEVFTPSTTKISSARFIRAMASERSRPATMSLAIVESKQGRMMAQA